MRRDAVKVFLAVALGSFVGTLVALQAQMSFWWVGLLVGGLTGYLAFDPLGVVRAVPMAWRQTRQELSSLAHAIRERLAKILWTVAALLALAMHAGLVIFLGMSNNETLQILILLALPIALIACLIVIGAAVIYVGEDDEDGILMILALNPVVLYLFVIPGGIGYCFYKVCRNIRSIAGEIKELAHDVGVFLGRFAWNLFRLVHSDIRLLCGVDAAIGACIGYFTANALLGAIAGGVFGVLNFELMSKRVLKFVSVKR